MQWNTSVAADGINCAPTAALGAEEPEPYDGSEPSYGYRLLLYPNPVAEELQLYFSGAAGYEHQFRILDGQGREWRRFATRLSEVTLLVEVGRLPGGVYYLQCLREGKVVKVEGFVKR